MQMSSSNYLFLRVELLGFRKGRRVNSSSLVGFFVHYIQDLIQVISEMA